MPRFAHSYIFERLAQGDYDALVDLQGVVLSWPQRNDALPDYGLPLAFFTFIETLAWFAQSDRSGAWTYFETTAAQRQKSMLAALQALAPDGYSAQYEFGMTRWRDMDQMDQLDAWIEATDDACSAWLTQLLRQHTPELLQIADAKL